MFTVMVVCFVLSFIFLLGMVYNLLAVKRSSAFPPMYILKKRAETLAISGFVFFFLALLLYWIT